MKGIVFSEYIEFVEDKLGMEIAERMIEECDLPSGGAYTAVGTYDHKEIVQLVVKLSELTDTPVPALLKAFGEHLYGILSGGYPQLVSTCSSAFELFKSIENFIHVEVRKLYSDVELPYFGYEEVDENTLKLTYNSERGFADLAEGLIVGAANHFNEDIEISRTDLSDGAHTHEVFTLTKRS